MSEKKRRGANGILSKVSFVLFASQASRAVCVLLRLWNILLRDELAETICGIFCYGVNSLKQSGIFCYGVNSLKQSGIFCYGVNSLKCHGWVYTP